jgi:hypothetical protein
MLVECTRSTLLTPKQTIDGDTWLVPSPAFTNVDDNTDYYFLKVQ